MRTIGGAGAGLAAGQVLGGLGALATGLGVVGGSRGVQKLLQNPQFVNRLLGNAPESKVQALLQQYANPATQGVLQAGQ
jgi:hypothetical protein